MQTRQDLLNVINTLKKEELKEAYHPYTMKQLGWFCNPNHIFHRYRDFQIPKKSGGTRKISAPRSHSYKYLLRYVGLILQSIYEPSTHAMGFIPQRSIVDNAKVHIGMNYVFNIDLKDFFPSIERARIVARLQVRPFNFTQEVALTIAGLCTMRVSNEEGAEKKYRYVLPQGSPASPVITNLMCDKLDYVLAGVAKRFGLNYTRYADDITFSSMHNVYQEDSDFRRELERVITSQGFTINEKKTRLDKAGARQEVTGLTVSKEKVNVARKYIRDLRGVLFMWEKYGYAAAETRLHIYANAKKNCRGCRKRGTSLICVVDGKLMFLKMVKGDTNSTYRVLQKRFDTLTNKQQKSQPQHTDYTYWETYNLREFERKKQVAVVFKQDGGKKYASFIMDGCSLNVGVRQDVDITTPAERLAISYCESADHSSSFWLIHKPYKSQYIKEKVDIDELNTELDKILNTDTEGAGISDCIITF